MNEQRGQGTKNKQNPAFLHFNFPLRWEIGTHGLSGRPEQQNRSWGMGTNLLKSSTPGKVGKGEKRGKNRKPRSGICLFALMMIEKIEQCCGFCGFQAVQYSSDSPPASQPNAMQPDVCVCVV
jgi:hypothetical protein